MGSPISSKADVGLAERWRFTVEEIRPCNLDIV
jgi:hypothetical protein